MRLRLVPARRGLDRQFPRHRVVILPGDGSMEWFAKLVGKGGKAGAADPMVSSAAAQHSLEKSIRSQFAPSLREDGFSGSGRTFRRLAGDMIQVVQVQGSRWGGQFAVNLGVHPTCVPVMGDQPFQAMKPELCVFRRRLSTGGADQWWEYETTAESMDRALAAANRVYLDVGRAAFASLTGMDSPLRTLSPQAFASGEFDFAGFATTDVLMAKALAVIRLAAGEGEVAKAFGRIALDRVGSASGLKREIQALVDGTWCREDW
jgi:hypothetical protein